MDSVYSFCFHHVDYPVLRTAPEMKRHILSKSTFIRGCQCEKSLYLYKKKYKLRDPLSQQQQAIFRRGTNVGLLAQELFPGGIDLSPPTPFQYGKAVEQTRDAVHSGVTCIYEAAFQYEQVLAVLDILVKEEDGWVGYEVKSSTGISEVYELDVSLQYYVITGAGLPLKDIRIIHINSEYVRSGKIEIEKLFTIASLKETADTMGPAIGAKIMELKKAADLKEEPDIDIGPHCTRPYPCDYTGYCWHHIPEYSVFNIHRLSEEKKFSLYREGIVTLDQVPDDFSMSVKQAQQVTCHKENKEIILACKIEEFLAALRYPLHFIDFETFQPAVPLFDRSRPYQQIPFQYSLHIIEEKGADEVHREFIAPPGEDPRLAFIEKLLADTEGAGAILVYNRAFETGRLKEISRDFPETGGEIEHRLGKVADLMIPFQKHYYYTPAMQGSYSIKKVLPSLVPSLNYSGLAIQEGSMASIVYESLQTEKDPEIVRTRLGELLRYCKMDTLAMVKIFGVLQGIGEAGGTASGPDPSPG